MRILFVANPGRSIFYSMVPLATALRTGGHEVRVASQPGFANEITATGLTAVPVGRNMSVTRMLRAYGIGDAEIEAVRPGLAPPFDAAVEPRARTWERIGPAYRDSMLMSRHECFPMVAGLVDFARSWRPDLVVWEPFSFAGPIAAKASGAVHARLLWSLDVFGITRAAFRQAAADAGGLDSDPLAGWFGDTGRRFGYEYSEDMADGHFTIDPFPPSLRMWAEELDYQAVHFVPYNGPAVVPRWLWEPPERPRVALTFGTTAVEQFGGYTIDVPAVLAALADLEVEVVATVAAGAQERLGAVPENARVVDHVPLAALAPTCAAVVNHAGMGTFLTCAARGVPQLLVPHHFDEPELAARAGRQGAVLVLDQGATAASVRHAVSRLLEEPSFGAGAARLRQEMHAMPGLHDLCDRLPELVETYRTEA